MATALVLSNNRLLINLDNNLQLVDLFYPYVGEFNQLNKYVNSMFLMIDGELVAVNNENCDFHMNYADRACIAEIIIHFRKTGLELRCTDLVLHDHDIYLRNFSVINNSENKHLVYLYFQNNFALSESIYADTAVWYQPGGCLLHYTKDVYLGIGSTGKIHQFTCAGKQDYSGKGAFPLETGDLPYNAVATGDVSSCLSYKYELQPKQMVKADYFIVATKSIEEIEPAVRFLRTTPFAELRQKTVIHWHERLFPVLKSEVSIKTKLTELAGKDFALKSFDLYWKSLMILLTQIDEDGAVIAANDGQFLKTGGTDSYSYFWPRDGANAVMALTDAGLQDEACRVLNYALKISNNKGFFWHKYFPGTKTGPINIGSSWHPWINHHGKMQLPIQEDATALMLIAIVNYYQKFGDKAFIIKNWHAIEAMIKFLKSFNLKRISEQSKAGQFVEGFTWDSLAKRQFPKSNLPYPSYDIWEQYYGVFTYTVVTVLEALRAGIILTDLAKARYLQEDLIIYIKELSKTIVNELIDKHSQELIKGIRLETETGEIINDNTEDASLLFAATFLKDTQLLPFFKTLIDKQSEKLAVKTSVGGWARKEHDHYLKIYNEYPGNPWVLTMLWLAQNHIIDGNAKLACQDITWVNDRADTTGLLAEQYDPVTGFSIGMKPLTWSHAEYIKTINSLIKLPPLYF